MALGVRERQRKREKQREKERKKGTVYIVGVVGYVTVVLEKKGKISQRLTLKFAHSKLWSSF